MDAGDEGMELIGNYAYRIEFSDGHNTGIYSFTFFHCSCTFGV